MTTPDTLDRSGKRKNGNRAIKTTSQKCGAGTIVGPVDLYIPSGTVAQIEFEEASAISPGSNAGNPPIVVKVSRIKPAWTPAHPQYVYVIVYYCIDMNITIRKQTNRCSDAVEPSRQLSPRIRDVARNGFITL